MKPEELEGNWNIGEFMGYRMFHKRYPRNHGIGAPENEYKDMIVEKAKYHSSWDWLMPVVEKIEKELYYKIYIFETSVTIWHKNVIEIRTTPPIIYSWLANYEDINKIEVVFDAISRFVVWYKVNG